VRPILKAEAICPVSGVKVGPHVVPVHRIPLSISKTGPLFGYCPIHEARVFIRNRATVAGVLQYETPTKEPSSV
jgi:hypothetical protein